MSRSFPVVLIPQPEGGYFAQCPTLACCYGQGETVEEALANIRKAIQLGMDETTERAEEVSTGAAPIITEVTVAA